MNNLITMFSYPFMVNALVVGVLISLSAALIGVPLVLRKNSMLSDGLSHVGFGAFAIASALGFAPLPIALPVVILASILILRLSSNSRLHGDSAIALLSVSALAIGTFIISITGSNVDINNYLFGSILSLGSSELWLGIILSLVVIILYFVFHNQIFALTFDETFARSIGIKTKTYNIIFAILCSIVVVLGMRLMGALLISSLIIFPTLSATTIYRNFTGVTIMSAILAVISFVLGLITSFLLATPTGATIVIVSLFIFLCLKLLVRIIR